MGSVRQAVLEFDEAVQAPWRPSLRVVAGGLAVESPRSSRPGAYRNRVAGCRAEAASEAPSATAPSATAPSATAPRSGAAATPGRRPAAMAARPRATGARTVTGPVRLTRRARRLAVVLALAAGVALGSCVGPLLTHGDESLRLAGVSTVVVGPGDTLWSIASSVAGDRDVRLVVDEIAHVNRLDGVEIVPGQVLRLP